jgi:hypothetical protein
VAPGVFALLESSLSFQVGGKASSLLLLVVGLAETDSQIVAPVSDYPKFDSPLYR